MRLLLGVGVMAIMALPILGAVLYAAMLIIFNSVAYLCRAIAWWLDRGV